MVVLFLLIFSPLQLSTWSTAEVGSGVIIFNTGPTILAPLSLHLMRYVNHTAIDEKVINRSGSKDYIGRVPYDFLGKLCRFKKIIHVTSCYWYLRFLFFPMAASSAIDVIIAAQALSFCTGILKTLQRWNISSSEILLKISSPSEQLQLHIIIPPPKYLKVHFLTTL